MPDIQHHSCSDSVFLHTQQVSVFALESPVLVCFLLSDLGTISRWEYPGVTRTRMFSSLPSFGVFLAKHITSLPQVQFTTNYYKMSIYFCYLSIYSLGLILD